MVGWIGGCWTSVRDVVWCDVMGCDDESDDGCALACCMLQLLCCMLDVVLDVLHWLAMHSIRFRVCVCMHACTDACN